MISGFGTKESLHLNPKRPAAHDLSRVVAARSDLPPALQTGFVAMLKALSQLLLTNLVRDRSAQVSHKEGLLNVRTWSCASPLGS